MAGNGAVAALLAARSTAVQRACGCGGACGCATTADQSSADASPGGPAVQRKGLDGDCESAPADDDPKALIAEGSGVEQQMTGPDGNEREDDPDASMQALWAVQRFTLDGFSTANEASMNRAVAKASSTVRSKKPKATCVANAIDGKTYKYVDDLGVCGWTYPLAGTIKIGKKAFEPDRCCALESTVAHEASHTCFYTEGGARQLECDTFSCSC